MTTVGPTVQISQPVSLSEAPGSSPINGVTVRPLQDTPEDATFAAKTMVEAFEGKFDYIVTRKRFPTAEKILTNFFQGQSPEFYLRNFVAELHGKPVGFLGLKYKDSTYNSNTDLLCELGCYRACRFLCFGCVTEFDVDDNRKCMLDVVGVDASARGKGVGKVLLDRADWEARKARCSMIYLMVVTDNRAVRLYERQGYSITETRGSCCLRYGIGPPGSIYVMEKPL